MRINKLSVLLIAAVAVVASGCGLKSSNELDATITPTPVVTVAPTVAQPSPTPVPTATPIPAPTSTPVPKAIGTKTTSSVMIPILNQTNRVITGLYIGPVGNGFESEAWGENLLGTQNFNKDEQAELFYEPSILNEEGKASIRVDYEEEESQILESVNLSDMEKIALYINSEDEDIYAKYMSISENAEHDTWTDWHDEAVQEAADEVDTTDISYDNGYVAPSYGYGYVVPVYPSYDNSGYAPSYGYGGYSFGTGTAIY